MKHMSNSIREPALSMKTIQLEQPAGSQRPDPRPRSASRRIRSRSSQSSWTNYLYIVPIFLFIIGFIYFAIIYTFYVSTLNWDGLSDVKIAVGLKNFVQIFQDPIFFGALRNTALFAVLTISIQMLLGLTMALLLRTQVAFKTVYKTIFFLPVVLAPAVIAYVFRHMLDANLGELNLFLTAIHLSFLAQSWLADPRFALFSLIGINIWEWTGFSFILYYAALTILDETLVEAARIDGANALQVAWHVIFPLLRSTNFSLVILGVIGALKTFDIIWLTTGGGPGRATEFLPTYIYKKTILEFNAGYSAALSVMLLLIALVITVIQLRAYQKQGGANA